MSLRRLLAGAGFALLGAVTAPAAALVSRMCWRSAAGTLPYGLLLSAAASLSVVLLARAVSRRDGLVAAIAWLLGLVAVVRNTPGGGFLVAGDALGWGFLVVDTLAVAGALLWLGDRTMR